ncbi:uncharacterized protein ACNLHF_024913 [Anomaloglossus baeobatrachus]
MFGIRYRKDMDVDIIELLLYPRFVPLDFIKGIKEDVQYKISIQETSPDLRAALYDNGPIYERKECDGPTNVIYFLSNVIRDKAHIGGYKERFMKVFKNIFSCCTCNTGVIEEDDLVYVRMKKDNQYNPIGAGTNIDFPDEQLRFPIQETGPVSEPLEDQKCINVNSQ